MLICSRLGTGEPPSALQLFACTPFTTDDGVVPAMIFQRAGAEANVLARKEEFPFPTRAIPPMADAVAGSRYARSISIAGISHA